jgi:HEAT repeat protein
MLRLAYSALIILFLATPLARAADDDPVIGDYKASDLLKILKEEKKPARRQAAVSLLGALGPKNRSISNGVLAALKQDEDPGVRKLAAQTLVKWWKDSKEEGKAVKGSIEALAERLKEDKEGAVREAAAIALGNMVPDSKKVLSVLVAALKDSHPGTRAAAAQALGLLGTDAELALPNLLTALQDKKLDSFTRIYAAQAISRLDVGGTKAIPALAGVLADQDTRKEQELRKAAAEALGKYGSIAQPAAVELGKALVNKDNDVEVRRAAVVSLGKIGADARAAWSNIRAALLKDTDSSVRYQAVRLAGVFAKGDTKVVPDLAECCEKDVNLETRLAAIEELAQLGPAAKDAVEVLKKLASEDSQVSVRKAAGEALKKIQKS